MARLPRGQLVNLVLVIAAVALLVVVVVTQGRVTTNEQDARSFNLLPAFREDDISRVSLERGGKRLVIVRAPADDAGSISWNIEEPVKEEAEAFAVDKLLGSLEYARFVRRIKPDEVDREAFGLNAPEWEMRITMGSISYVLRLGKEAASPAGAHYLELLTEGGPGSSVVLVSRDLVTELSVDASSLRARQLIPYLSPLLSKIAIVGTDGETRSVTKMGERAWRFVGAFSGSRVDREAFDQVLVHFARIKAEHFLSVAEAEAALAKGSKVSLELVPTDGKQPTARIVVGGACPKSDADVVAVRREPDPLAGCVPRSVLAGLDVSAESLVDRHLFWLRKDEVESLRIHRGDKKLELDRTEAGFALRAPVKGEVELETGNERIGAIVRAEGKRLDAPDPKKLGLVPPTGTVTVRSAAESDEKVLEEVLELGASTSDGGMVVRRRSDSVVLELAADAARTLTADSTLVRSSVVLDFAPSELESVEVTGRAPHQKLHRDESGRLVLELPKGFAHDATLATALVDELAKVRADRWVADDDDGTFGLSEPRARAQLSFAAGDASSRQYVLVVGAPTVGGAFAKLQGEPGVFVAPRRLVDTLDTWLLDRAVFMVTPDNASEVVLERKGKSLSLERRGDRFVRGPGVDLSDARVAEIFEALIALRAEAAVHTGGSRPGEGFESPELVVRLDGGKGGVITVGAGDSWQGASVHYIRKTGVDATYVIAKNKVRPFLDAF